MKKVRNLIGLLFIFSLSACATYRTNSDVEFASTEIEKVESNVQILEGDLVDLDYSVIGPVVATVKKLTVFHKDPTKEQVDVVLTEKAKQMGANAVINVSYNGGVGLTTWGFMTGEGTAVKTEE